VGSSLRLAVTVLGLSVVVALALPACGSLLSRTPGPVGVTGGRLLDCPPTPNCVCSQADASDGRHAVAPLPFEGDPTAAFERLLALAVEEDGAELVARRGGWAHLVYRTRLMRFADDVEFLLERGAGVIHVRSASRVGRSDLGANRARVESLRRRFSRP
jgi:uncharacterized protein (DUF1499 family)